MIRAGSDGISSAGPTAIDLPARSVTTSASASSAAVTNSPAPDVVKTAGRGTNPGREVADVVGGQLVGGEVDAAGEPAALGRGGVNHGLDAGCRGAAREGAAGEGDPIGERIAGVDAQRDFAARRPSRRTRLGERDRMVFRTPDCKFQILTVLS